MDIKIDTTKGWLKALSSSSSRESSVHSDPLSMDYVERVQILANNYIWANQVKNKKL